MEDSTRRRFLRSSTIGLGAALSGCLRLAGSGTETEDTPTSAATDTETPAPDDTTGAGDTETPDAGTETTTPYPVSLSERWRQFFEPVGPPLVTDDRVFVPTRDQGVTAVAADGEIDWQTVVAAGFVPWHRPTLHGGDLYLSAFEDNVGLFRVDAASGTVAESQSLGPSGGPVAATDDGVVVGTDHNEGGDYEEELFGFDRTGLSESWSDSAQSQYQGGVGYDGTAFVGFGGNLEARDPTTGDVQWSFERYAFDVPTVHDGDLYLVTEERGKRVLAQFDPATGDTNWTHRSPTADSRYVHAANPGFANGTAYIASAGSLYAVDLDPGERQWSAEVGGPVDASPAVVDGVVWVTPTAVDERNRELLGFDVEDGTKVYHDTLLAETVRPLAFDGHLVVQLANQIAAFAVE